MAPASSPSGLPAPRLRRDAGGNALLEGGGGAIAAAGLDGVMALAIAAAPIGITVADPSLPDCPLVFANPAFCRITGYAPEEVLGRNCRFLQGPGTEREPVRSLRRAVANGEPVTVEVTNHRKDGRRFVNELRLTPVRDAAGRVIATLGIQHDVSLRRRAEKEASRARKAAEKASQEKSDFLAFVSHEVRTPLHGAMGTLSLLLDTALDAEQRAYAETALRCGTTLLRMVNELLDLSRIEAGKLLLQPRPFALAEVVREVLDLLAPAAAEKGLEIGASLDHLLPARVVGDPDRIRQVLMNLADNAVKFTGRGAVELRLAALPDGHVGFAVTDTGIGIPPRLRASLFTRFAQAEPAGERMGAGLGLAICKQLVELMGGQIAVDSTPGCGSTFFFDLPLEAVPDGGTAPEHVGPPEASPTQPAIQGRILLAEDSKAGGLVGAVILRKAGYTVELARDGAEALAAARSADFDLVLMDLHMPVLDGYAVTRAIRRLPAPRGEVPIIAMTASTMAAEERRCLEAGMDAHLPKPMDGAALLAAVARALQGRPHISRAAPCAGAGNPPLLDRQTLEELRAAVGSGRLLALVTAFVEESRIRIARMLAQPHDPRRIVDEAHTLTAAAATFGALALRDAAAALEEAARHAPLPELARQAAALSPLVERTAAAFPRLRARQRD